MIVSLLGKIELLEGLLFLHIILTQFNDKKSFAILLKTGPLRQ